MTGTENETAAELAAELARLGEAYFATQHRPSTRCGPPTPPRRATSAGRG